MTEYLSLAEVISRAAIRNYLEEYEKEQTMPPLVTAVTLPNKLYFVRVCQRDETGSLTAVLYSGDLIASSPESARAVAFAAIGKTNPDADLTRLGVAIAEITLA